MTKTRTRLPARLIFVVLATSLTACVSHTLRIETTSRAEVSAQTLDKLGSPGRSLGFTPLTVDLDKLVGRVLKISQPGKSPVYWLVTDLAGQKTFARLDLPDAPTVASSGKDEKESAKSEIEVTSATNRILRLLLRSYQALAVKDFDLASELAEQAQTLNPKISAPHVIKGIAFLKGGKTSQAKAAFLTAKALDPEDLDLNKLIEAAQ